MPRPYKSPTPKELKVINEFLDSCKNQPPFNYSAGLLPLLPGWSKQDIRNHVNLVIKRRRGLCTMCGKHGRTGKYKTCSACRARKREALDQLLAKGLCTRCRKARIDDGGSTTACSACLAARQQRYGYVYNKNRNEKGAKVAKRRSRNQWYNLLNWLGSKTVPFFLHQATKSDLLVDLFGGSGDLTIRAAMQGYEVLAYNDIHPLLVSYMRVLQAGQHAELCKRIKASTIEDPALLKSLYEHQLVQAIDWVNRDDHKYHGVPADHPDATIDIGRAAILYQMSHSVAHQDMVKKVPKPFKGLQSGHRSRMKEAAQVLEDIEITCLDFHEAIDWHDCDQTLFYVDPPWIKGSEKYEYDIGQRHADLVSHLMDARGRFVMVMEPSKAGLEAMQSCPCLYFLSSVGGAKVLIGSDFELHGHGLELVDKNRYGYLKAS